jgi:glyoxylase-like metal-dependent hydrolase (beta-lactamase superfamily II)
MFSHVYTPVRYRVGSIEIAVISDGYMKLDAGAVMGLIPRVMWEPILGKENIDAEHRMKLSLNCMVVRSESQVLLVDTGLGDKLTGATRDRAYPGEYGKLLEGLASLGLRPEDVTAVANTHLHADHCGWNTVRDADGTVRPTFPNARYYIQAGEYEAATHPNERTRGTYFADNFEPLAQAGQLELVDGEAEIIPGARFWATPGHTEDHASIALTSGGETAIYTGDLVHHAVQVERPAWIAAFDILPLQSLESKKKLAERALRENALLICVHNPWPGVGRLTEAAGRRTFVEE